MAEPETAVRVCGRGTVEVAAYGLADAEHLVEKEIRRAWPEARVQVLEVGRAAGEGRIVEHFAVRYRITAEVRVHAHGEQAPGEAFRLARGLLQGTRYHRTAWETA